MQLSTLSFSKVFKVDSSPLRVGDSQLSSRIAY